MAILVMNTHSINFLTFKKTKEDQQEQAYCWHALKNPSDIDGIHNSVMSHLGNEQEYLHNFCYLLIKV